MCWTSDHPEGVALDQPSPEAVHDHLGAPPPRVRQLEGEQRLLPTGRRCPCRADKPAGLHGNGRARSPAGTAHRGRRSLRQPVHAEERQSHARSAPAPDPGHPVAAGRRRHARRNAPRIASSVRQHFPGATSAPRRCRAAGWVRAAGRASRSRPPSAGCSAALAVSAAVVNRDGAGGVGRVARCPRPVRARDGAPDHRAAAGDAREGSCPALRTQVSRVTRRRSSWLRIVVSPPCGRRHAARGQRLLRYARCSSGSSVRWKMTSVGCPLAPTARKRAGTGGISSEGASRHASGTHNASGFDTLRRPVCHSR